MHHINTNKTHGEKARWELHKYAMCCFELILEATPNKTAAVWPPTSHLKNHQSKMNKTSGTLLENKDELMSVILLLTFTHGRISDGWPARTYISSIQTLDVVKRTSWERWMIGTDEERETEKSMLSMWLDDDDKQKVTKWQMKDKNWTRELWKKN